MYRIASSTIGTTNKTSVNMIAKSLLLLSLSSYSLRALKISPLVALGARPGNKGLGGVICCIVRAKERKVGNGIFGGEVETIGEVLACRDVPAKEGDKQKFILYS